MKKISLVVPLAAALLLSGCYEASTLISVGGDSIEKTDVTMVNGIVLDGKAYLEFAGVDWRSDDPDEATEANAAARRLDPFVVCDGLEEQPRDGFVYYTSGLPEKDSFGRGARYAWAINPGKSVTCKVQTGGVRVSNTSEGIVVEGAVAVPDIRDYEERGFVKIQWDENWTLEDSNGFTSYTSNEVKWSAAGGSRLEIYAALRLLEPGEEPLARTISGLVVDEATDASLIPSGPEQPSYVEGVEAAALAVGDQEIPDGYEIVYNSDGSVELVEEASVVSATPLGSTLVYGAWGLLGVGVISLLVVGGMALGRPKREG